MRGEQQQRTVRGSSRTFARLSAAGFALGAAGVALQAVTGAELPRPVPPGVVVLAVASAVTARFRWRWIHVGSASVAVLALLNVLGPRGSGALRGGEGFGVATGKCMLLVGAGTALISSVLSILASTVRTVGAPSSVNYRHERGTVWPRRFQIVGLLVLAPVCAEYLAAYDDSTGAPLQLLGGLSIFIPLYGAPALLIREISQRAGLGWTGILLLSAAFGLAQAGAVDQSLFSDDYRSIASWDDALRGTYVAPLGLSVYNVLNFVGGHMIYSICAPIALVEAFRPSHHRVPWLNPWPLGVTAALYLAASALVLNDSLTNESSHASTGEVVGTLVVVGLLVLGAFAFGSRGPDRSGRPTARVRTTFAFALVVALVYGLAPTTWPGVAVSASALVFGGALVLGAARSAGWNPQHVVAIASAAVLTRAVLAFTYFPVIGDVSALRKYGHNTVFLIAMAALCLLASQAADPGQSRPLRSGSARATGRDE